MGDQQQSAPAPRFRLVPGPDLAVRRSTPPPLSQPQQIPQQPIQQIPPPRPMHYVSSAPVIRSGYQAPLNGDMAGYIPVSQNIQGVQMIFPQNLGNRPMYQPRMQPQIMQPAPIHIANSNIQHRSSPIPQQIQYQIRQPIQQLQPHQIQQPAPIQQPQQQVQQQIDQHPEQAVTKCARFFKTLLHLSQNNKQYQTPNASGRVRELVKGVVYAHIEPEEFTTKLQEVLHSQAQPNLLPFLQKTLPHLRQALQNGEVTIDGLEDSPSATQPRAVLESRVPPVQTTTGIRIKAEPQMAAPTFVKMDDLSNHRTLSRPSSAANLSGMAAPVPTTYQGPMPSTTIVVSQQPDAALTTQPSTSSANTVLYSESTITGTLPKQITVVDTAGRSVPQEIPVSGPESAVITQPLISSQLKYTLLDINALAYRVVTSMPENDQGVVDEEVLTLISHAVESRLRNLLGHLSTVAEHRLEPFRLNPLYEQVDDPRKQIRFVEDVEKQVHNRRETLEREALIRMSKSKGKDKDTLEKAKQLQRAEQEARLNLDANAAAIAALGGARATKRTFNEANNPLDQPSSGGLNTQTHRPRIKRVTTKDLQFVLGMEPMTRNSNINQRLAYSNIAVDPQSSL